MNTERVSFTKPVYANDLRIVLAAHTAREHDDYKIVYKTQYGEVREILWLSLAVANTRCAALRLRGTPANVQPM